MVVLCSDVLDNDLVICHQLAYLQIAPLNVARPLAGFLVLRELDRTLVVYVKNRWLEVVAEFAKQAPKYMISHAA